MSWRSLILYACVALATAGFPAARGETLELVNVLEIRHEGVEDVSGLGGLTFRDSFLWMGYAWSEYSYYYGNGALSELDTETAWVGRVSPTDGAVLEEFPIPGSDWPYAPMSGLASSGPNLYAALRTEGIHGICEFAPGEVVGAVYGFQGEQAGSPGGLTHDGTYLWQALYAPSGHLYAINPANNERVNDLRVDPFPSGLTWDGRYFYVSHVDRSEGTYSYIAKYDRAGNRLATFDLPAALASAPIGDLAIDGQNLYAHVLETPQIAQLLIPPSMTAPPLPDGITRQAVAAEARIVQNNVTEHDQQAAGDPGQLPVAASLRRVMGDYNVDVLANARSYHDGDGYHNKLHALAYGAYQELPLEAAAELTVSKTVLIEPQKGLPAGTPVWAKATMTLNGLLQLCRSYGEPYETMGPSAYAADAEGLIAGFGVQIVKTDPGADETVFLGIIGLVGSVLGDGAEDWLLLSQEGDFEGAFTSEEIGYALTIEDNFAALAMEGLEFDFRVPAEVGVPFDVDVIFRGLAVVPEGAEGLGAEVVFGESPLLVPGYTPPLDEYYGDGFPQWYPRIRVYMPEPGVVLLLAAGMLGVCRRRRGR